MNQRLWRTVFRSLILSLFVVGLLVGEVRGQDCNSLIVTGQNSGKIVSSLCSPVTANLNVQYSFGAPLAAGFTYIVRYNWGDGTANTNIPVAAGTSNINLTQPHVYPANSDCEYQVIIRLVVNGAVCFNTTQTQIISTWRTDAFNGGLVQMISPTSGNNIHEVCEGVPINVIFNDLTNFNCNANYPSNYPVPPSNLIQFPNQQVRWQQIVYNTNNPAVASRIPNVSVNGVLMPAAPGSNYQDPRGVFQLTPLVVVNDPRRRASLPITAPGGFGVGFPVVGDEFQITVKYWNLCNPYDDPAIPGPPADLINGDSPAVTATALIRIIDSPNSPAVPNRDFCSSETPTMNVTPTVGGLTYRWYASQANAIADVGVLQTGASFTPSNAQAPIGNRTHFWVTAGVTAALGNCRSAPTEVTVTRRPALPTPPAITGPANLCPSTNGYSYSVSGGAPANVTITDVTSGNFSLATDYFWSVPGGLTIAGGQNTDAITVNTGAGTPSGNVSVVRRYETTVTSGSLCPSAPQNRAINVRAAPTASITPDPFRICQGTDTPINGNPTISFGAIVAHTWSGPGVGILSAINVQTPNVLGTTPPGVYSLTYTVTAQYEPGVTCSGSDNITVTIDPVPAKPTITPSGATTFCFGGSVTLTSSNVGGLAASYRWYRNGVFTGTTTQNIVLNSVAQSGDYTVEVIAAAPTNCTSPLSDPTTVTINALPTATVSGGGSACLATPAPDIVWNLTGATNFNFTITASTPEPGFPINMVGYGSTTFTIVAPNPAATTTYEMTVLSDGNTCVATSRGGPITVTVQAIPPPTVETFTGQPPVCDDGGATNPPDAILDLLPNSVQNYAITYRLRRISTGLFLPGSINFTGNSSATGVINLAPTYAQFGAVPNDPMGYQVVITAIQNTVTLCAGAVPINGPTLIINPRPPPPTGAVPGIACQTSATGAPISVDIPPVGFTIVWSTTASPTFTAAAGATGGTRGNSFTPTSNATATYHAFTRDDIVPTNCLSASSLPVLHTQDLQPAAAVGGPAQPNLCVGTASMGATPATNGGSGTWTVLGQVAYIQDFENAAQYPIGTANSSSGNGWTINTSAPNAFPQQGGGGIFSVQAGKRFLANNTNGGLGGGVGNIGEVVWTSAVIDVSSLTSISASVDMINASPGQNEAVEDYIRVLYRLNGGGEIQFPTNGFRDGDFANTTASVTGLVGATFQVVVRVSNTAANEFIAFDNIIVRQTGSTVSITDPNAANATISGLPQNPPGGAPINYTARWTVASALGVCASSSSNVTLTVNAIPAVFNQTPQVCEDTEGGGVHGGFNLTTLDALVTGGAPGVTVEWFAGPGLTNPIIPATTPQNITNGAGGDFFVRLSTPIPCVNTTGTVTFTVNTLPPAANPTLVSRTFCEDVQGSGSHAGVNLGVYNGQINGTSTITWYPTLADAMALTNQIMPGVGVGQVGNYTVFNGVPITARVVDGNNCANFREVFPVVNPLPADNVITGNDVDCSSPTAVKVYQANAALNAFGTTHVYNWTVNGAGINFEVFDGSTFVTTNNYAITQNSFLLLVRFPNPGTFTFTVSETIDGCTGNTVNKIVNVSGAPPALAFNAPPTQVCKNQTGVTYSLTTAPQAGSNYVWTVVGGTIVGPSSGNITTITVNWGSATAPQPSVSVTESNASGCAGAPASVNVFLNDNPVMVSPNSATICSGAAPSSQLTFSATLGGAPPVSAMTFNWNVVSVPANVTGVVNGQMGSGQLNMVLSNVSGVDGIVTFEVTPVENDLPNPPNCTSAPQTIFITVKPQPIINAGQTKLICNNTAVNHAIQLTPANLPASTTFSWALPTMSDASVQGTAQAGVPIGATPHITDVLTNATNSTITATYNVVPSNGTCSYPSVPIVITIEPAPAMVANLTSAATQCNGSNVNINLTTPTTPNTASDIKWDVTVTQTAGAGVAAGTAFANLTNQTFTAGAATLNGTLTNSGNNAATVRFVFTPKLQGTSNCAGVALAPIDVVVEPTPTMTRTLTTASTICNGGTVNFDLTTLTTPSTAGDIKWDVTVTQTGGAGVAAGTAFANLTNQTFTAGAATLNGTLTNSGNNAATVRFVFTPKLQGSSNCAGVAMAPVDVVVEPTPTMTRTLTTASTICNGGNVNFNLTTPTTPNTAGDIKWDVTVTQTGGSGVAAGTAFANLTNQTFTAGAATLNGTLTNSGNNAATVRFVFTPKLQGTSNCAGVALAPIDVVVEPTPTMTRTLTTASTICNGGAVNFDLTTLTTPSTAGDIKWDVTVTQTGGAGVAAGTAFANLTNQTFTAGAATLNGTLTNSGNNAATVRFVFTPRLQGSSNCAGVAMAPVDVIVEPTPTMTRTLTTASTICNGGTVNFNLTTPTTPNTAADIKWDVTVTQTGGAGVAAGTAFANLTNQTFTAGAATLTGTLTNSGNNAATVRFVFTPKLQGSSNCPGVALAPIDVVVEPTPTMTRTLSTASTICNGGTVNFDLTTLTTPSTAGDIKWDVTVTQTGGAGVAAGTAFANLTNQTFTAGAATLNGTLTNSGNNAATVRFVFTPKLQGSSNCPGVAMAPVDVIVEPTPTMTRTLTTASTICNGGTVNFNLTTPTTPNTSTDIKWDVTVTQTAGAGVAAGTAFANLTNQTFAAGAATLNGTLTNSGNNAATVRFVFTPKLQGISNCPGVALAPIDVVVEPTPTMTRTLTTASTICNGGTVNFDLTTLTTPSTAGDIKWDVTVTQTGGAGVAAGTAFANLTNQTFTAGAATLNGTLTNSGNNAATVRFVFTPKLQGSSNCAGVAMAPVDVVVEPTPTMTRTLTTASTICNGGNVNFNLTTPTTPNTAGDIKWDVTVTQTGGSGVAAGTAFANLTNQTFVAGSATLTGTLTNSGNNAATVRFVFTPKLQGTSNCAGVALAPVDVIVEPTPTATIGNSTPVVCNNGNVNILISSPTSPSVPADLRFDLNVSSSNPGATGGTAFTPLANQSFPVLIGGTLTNSSDNFITVTYTVTPKLQGTSNCPGIVPPSVNVIVEPTPKVTATNNQPRLCNGGTPDISITSVTGPSVPGNLTFDIIPSLPPGITGTGNAGSGVTSVASGFVLNTGTLSNSTNISQTVVYTVTPKLAGCVNGPSQNVNVIVEPTPQVSLTNNLPKICNGGTPNITVTSPTSPSVAGDLTFDVVVTLPGGVTGTGVAGNGVLGASAPFAINTGTISNTNASFQTITYTVTPKLNGCADGPPQMVNVIVEPTPVAVATNNLPTICNGGTPDISITSPTGPSVPANLTFDVTVSLPAGVSGTGVAGSGTTGASAPFSINTGTLTNSTNTFRTVVYTITPKLSGCANGTPQVVNVIVEPTPSAAFVSNSPAICTGASPSIDVTSPTSPSIPGNRTFDVAVSMPAGVTGTGVAGSGLIGATAPFSINTGTLTHDNASNTPLVVTYTITPKLAGCADGTPLLVNVTVRPNPVGAFDNSRIVCSDEAFTYNIQTANIDLLGNQVASNFTFTVSSSDEANVPTPVGLDRTIASNAPINGNFNNANLAGANVDITYSITPFNSAGNCAGTPFDVVVRIRPEPTAPATTTVEHCSNAAAPFVFDLQSIIDTGIGGNSVPSKFTYTVSSTNPLTVFPESNRNVATSAVISHVYSNFSGVDETVTYVVTPFSTAGDCPGSTFDFKVIVHPEPVGSNVTDPKCSTTLNYNIQSQITNGLNSIFTYTVSSDNGGVPAGPNRLVASNAPITDTYTNATGSPANITYTITPFNAANPTCPGAIFTYTVNVSPNPSGTNSVEPAVCSDVPFTVDPQNNIVPAVASTFTWTATYDAPLSGPASGSGMITGSLHNETNGQLFAHYTVTPTAGVCVGAPFTIDLPINPEPVMLPSLSAPPAVCSTNTVSSNPINVILRTNGPSQAAASYIISLKSQDAGLVGTPTTGTFPANSPIAGESDAIANDTYRNTTAAQLKVVYTVIPVSAAPASCQGDPFDITVSINPEPVLDNPGFPAVCSSNTAVNSPVNIVLGTNGISVNAAGYQLQNVQYSTGGPFSPAVPPGITPNAGNAVIMGAFGSNNLIRNDRYNNTSANPVTIRYTIQGRSSTLCLSEPLNYDVVVDPEPTLVPGTATTCSGIPVAPPLTLMPGPTSPAITSYELQQINIPAGVAPNGGNAGLGVYATGTFLQADFFFNTLDVNRDVVYTIVPISGTCRGIAQTVTVTIQPAPAMFANLNAKACNETASGIVLLDNSIGNPMATAPFSAAAATFDITSITLAPGVTAFGGTNTAPRVTASQNEISGDRFTNNTNNPLTVTYRVVPISATGCRGPEKVITLTVEPRIIADDPPDDLVCSSVGGATNTNIVLTSPINPSSGLVTFNYTAVSSMIGPTAQIGGFSSGLGNLPEGYAITDALVNTSNTPGTVTYTITPIANSGGGAGCNVVGSAVAQQTVVITVEPKPKVVTTFSPVPVCEGVPTSIQLTTPTTPSAGTIQFNVAATPNGGLTLTSALKTNYLPGEFITDVWNNPTGDPQTVQYAITPSVSGGLGCPGDPTNIFVTINPRPQLQPATQADICSGTPISIPINQIAPIVGTASISWTFSAPGALGVSGGTGTSIDQTPINNTPAPILVTYAITPNASGCSGTPLIVSFNVNPNPTITTLPSQITICEGTSPNVALTSAVAGTGFAWTVMDLNVPPTGLALNGSGNIINQVIPNNTGGQTSYLYEVTPTGPTGCVGPPKFMTVNVISIIPDVIPDKSVICSGERVQFFNQTLGFGPGGHRWFYRVQGTTAEIDVKTSAVVNYQFTNTTATNPIIYEVVYQASNTGNGFSCTKAPVVVPITVYRNVVANWNPGVIPSLKGGSSVVNFTNTSTPVDPQFRYEWDFGDKATPSTFTGATPPPVNFSQQGPHIISLKAINIAAEPPGPGCEDVETRTIVVPVDPLVADFVLDPTAACFPNTVKVIENNATGNVMEWEVIDSNGKLVTTSNLNTPEFLIRAPGLYTVNLTTSDSFLPGLIATSQKTFEIYDKPIASFQARPTTVFVPDTELNTFNFSTGANFYEWDFGDGETSDEREPKHIYKIEGVYDIVLVAGFEHDDGIVCTDSVTQKISAKQGGQTKVPNAFTPNPAGPSGGFNGGGSGSGGAGSFNDVFLPIVKGVEEFNMQIFDRWGNLIFESNNSNQGWDGYDKNGRILPSGVYIYKLTLRLSDGQRTTQIGDITMIR